MVEAAGEGVLTVCCVVDEFGVASNAVWVPQNHRSARLPAVLAKGLHPLDTCRKRSQKFRPA